MLTRRTAFRFTALFTLATLATPLWASTVLTFDVTSHNEPAKGAQQVKGPPKPADEHYAMTVTLAGDSLQVDKPNTRTRYDFRTARIDRLELLKHTYEDTSLYAVTGFNVAEFANRMMLGKMLAAGKIKDNPMAPALTEHLMSLSDPANGTVIDTRTVGPDTVYSWANQPLMTVSQKTREVPAATLTQYLRFLRYEVGGHPKILAAIEQGSGLPERLTIVRQNIGTETRTLTLQGLTEQPDAPFSLDGTTRAIPDREPFTTLKRLSPTPATDLEARVAVVRQERDAALVAGHVFDAALANFIVGLSTGDQGEATTWLRSHFDQLNAEGNIGRLMVSLEPHDEASAKQAADTLAGLKQAGDAHSYVLNIFEANVRTSLKDGAKARELFLAALTINPTIAGAWIDLAELYYKSFDPEAAWACWDAARSLNATHPLLRDINALEQKLRTDHPEFF